MLVLAPALAPIPAGATPGTPAATSGGAANGLLPSAEATGDGIDGAAAVQLGGTAKCPIDPACPRPADIEVPVAPRPVIPGIPWVPEPRPAANGERWPSPSLPANAPGLRKLALVTVCAICAGLKVPVEVNVFHMFAFGPQVLQKLSSRELPEEPPLSRLSSPESPDVDDDVDVAGDERPCSVLGTAEVSCDNDACVLVPAAWVAAAACPASAPGAVVCGAVVNDGTLDAVADCAA